MDNNSTDQVEITLPHSKQKVVIRNYTKDSDDVAYNAVLFDGVVIGIDGKYELPVLNSNRATRVYVEKLVISIGDSDANISHLLGELRSEDYKAVETKVLEITGNNSPKAKADK